MTTMQRGATQTIDKGEPANECDLMLNAFEVQALTGYRQAAKQLAELHRQGYWRARRAPITGRILLERAHYDAVARGQDTAPTALAKPAPKLRRVS